MSSEGFLGKISLFFQDISLTKKIIFAVVILLVLILTPVVLLMSKKTTTVEQKSKYKTWEVILSFDTDSRKLISKKVTLIDKKITQDNRSADFSPYELVMESSNEEVLYRTKINITTDPLYDMSIDPPASGSSQPEIPDNLDTVVYVPYLEKGTKLLIKENSKNILEIKLPVKKNSLGFFNLSKAYAQTQGCAPLVVAFVSDGYTDFNKFHQDIETFRQIYLSVDPYNTQSIFDFRAVDNSESLGCKASLNCVGNSRITQIAKATYPDTSKVIVLVDKVISGGALGVTSGIGGNVAVFPNNGGNIAQITRVVAAHEFLGHAVGLLYDRYVSSSSTYGKIQGNIRSNCTDNPSGENFWQTAGGQGVFNGCGNKSNYASSPITCAPPLNPQLLASGNPNTMMSAAGCANQPIFDSVEKYWIRTNVLPKYCGGTPGVANPQPPPPGGSDPGTGGTDPGGTNPQPQLTPLVKGTVFTDTNGNQLPDAGEGFQGATVTLSGPYSGTVSTNNNGEYSFTLLPVGSYTISARAGQVVFNQVPEFKIEANVYRVMNFVLAPGAGGTNPGTGGGVCGDGTCSSSETSTTCPSDCTSSGGGTNTGTNPGTGGGTTGGSVPTPTPYTTANCEFDTSCVSGKNGIQLCTLKCTPI